MKTADKGKRVADTVQLLIVEDDLDLVEMLSAYFQVQGYDVATATWGEEAVHIAQDVQPALIVLDIHLPDIDGYEVCRRLRSHRRTQTTPVIFLTERRARGDRLSGLELGVVDYITKPFDIQELRLRVRNALQRAATTPRINPITNLPDSTLVNEKLSEVFGSDSAWAVVLITINGLDRFRELYGFVAADDVLRAVSLMLNNAVREAGTPDDLVGQLAAHDFVIVTDMDHVHAIRERAEMRLSQSMEYFFPLKDRSKAQEAAHDHCLTLAIGQLTHAQGPFVDLDALRAALLASRKAIP